MSKIELVGQKIVHIRPLNKREIEHEGWDAEHHSDKAMCIILDNGVHLYPSMDYEGNGGGALFGYAVIDKEIKTFAI